MRVLIETRFSGVTVDSAWYPDFEAEVLAETEHRVCVKRHWWSRRGWYPKAGAFYRVAKIL